MLLLSYLIGGWTYLSKRLCTNVKKGNLATPTGEQAPINTPEANSSTVSRHSIRKSARNVNSISENQTETESFKKWFVDWQNAQRKTQTSAFPSGLTPRSGRSGFCHTGKGSNFPYTKCPVFFRERNVLRIPKYSPVSLQFRCCCGIVSCRLCCPEATQG